MFTQDYYYVWVVSADIINLTYTNRLKRIDSKKGNFEWNMSHK